MSVCCVYVCVLSVCLCVVCMSVWCVYVCVLCVYMQETWLELWLIHTCTGVMTHTHESWLIYSVMTELWPNRKCQLKESWLTHVYPQPERTCSMNIHRSLDSYTGGMTHIYESWLMYSVISELWPNWNCQLEESWLTHVYVHEVSHTNESWLVYFAEDVLLFHWNCKLKESWLI